MQAKSTAEILKFRSKAQVKFSRKFHKIFALRQRGICNRASSCLSWAASDLNQNSTSKAALARLFLLSLSSYDALSATLWKILYFSPIAPLNTPLE